MTTACLRLVILCLLTGVSGCDPGPSRTPWEAPGTRVVDMASAPPREVDGAVVGYSGTLRAGLLLYPTGIARDYGVANAQYPNRSDVRAYYSGIPGRLHLLVNGDLADVQYDVAQDPVAGGPVYLAEWDGVARSTPAQESGSIVLRLGTVEDASGYDRNHYGSTVRIRVALGAPIPVP